jgi:hypothetical protein
VSQQSNGGESLSMNQLHLYPVFSTYPLSCAVTQLNTIL